MDNEGQGREIPVQPKDDVLKTIGIEEFKFENEPDA